MSNTSLENRIQNLQARLQAENEARERDKLALEGITLQSPRHGSGRRPTQRKF